MKMLPGKVEYTITFTDGSVEKTITSIPPELYGDKLIEVGANYYQIAIIKSIVGELLI